MPSSSWEIASARISASVTTAAGVADDVRVPLAQAERGGGVQAGVHARDDREPARRLLGQAPGFEPGRVGGVVGEQVVELAHGRRMLGDTVPDPGGPHRVPISVPSPLAAALLVAPLPAAADAPAPPLRAPVAGHATVGAQMRAAARELRLRAAARRGAARAPAGARRAALRRLRAFERVPVPGGLDAIAACESGGDPDAVGGGGLYRGKYQFDRHTWRSVGGAGDPAAAPEAEQDARAARLYRRAGAAPWPVCGA